MKNPLTSLQTALGLGFLAVIAQIVGFITDYGFPVFFGIVFVGSSFWWWYGVHEPTVWRGRLHPPIWEKRVPRFWRQASLALPLVSLTLAIWFTATSVAGFRILRQEYEKEYVPITSYLASAAPFQDIGDNASRDQREFFEQQEWKRLIAKGMADGQGTVLYVESEEFDGNFEPLALEIVVADGLYCRKGIAFLGTERPRGFWPGPTYRLNSRLFSINPGTADQAAVSYIRDPSRNEKLMLFLLIYADTGQKLPTNVDDYFVRIRVGA